MSVMENNVTEWMHTPITDLSDLDGWQTVPIEECGEKLIPLSAVGIPTASFYAGLHDFSPYQPGQLKGSLTDVYVRTGTAKRLQAAQELLPPYLSLLILDGYRPRDVQASLYNFYRTELKQQRPTWSDEALDAETAKYVSLPSEDTTRPPTHNTGGTIDGWIIRLPDGVTHEETLDTILQNAVWLEAGAPFDHGGEKAALDYYEHHHPTKPSEVKALQNRRVMYWLMQAVGMEALPTEYWHFNAVETQMGARAIGGTAIYGSAENQGLLLPSSETDPVGQKKIATHFPDGEVIAPQFVN